MAEELEQAHADPPQHRQQRSLDDDPECDTVDDPQRPEPPLVERRPAGAEARQQPADVLPPKEEYGAHRDRARQDEWPVRAHRARRAPLRAVLLEAQPQACQPYELPREPVERAVRSERQWQPESGYGPIAIELREEPQESRAAEHRQPAAPVRDPQQRR